MRRSPPIGRLGSARRLLHELGREKDVIRLLEPEAAKYPDDIAIAYLLGTALIRQKRVAEGQVLVDRSFAMAIRPKHT